MNNIVWMNGRQGVVLRKRGPNAIDVRVYAEVPEKDFLTGKLTVWKGFRVECWPIKKLETQLTQHDTHNPPICHVQSHTQPQIRGLDRL